MSKNNAKSQESTIRRTQKSGDESATDPGGQEGTDRISGKDEDIPIGITGTIGARKNSNRFAAVTGGIVAQLIRDAEDRLTKAKECIDWYEREKGEEEKRLEDLRSLQALAQELESESNEPE